MFNKFEAIKTLNGPYNYVDFFLSVLKQMPLFPLIPSSSQRLSNFFLEVTLPFSFTSKIYLDWSDLVQFVWMYVVRRGW